MNGRLAVVALILLGLAPLGLAQSKTFQSPDEWRRNNGKPPITQTCPISVLSVDSSGNGKAGLLAAMVNAGSSSTWLTLKYQNVSDKRVSGIRFAVTYFNSVQEPFRTEDVTTPAIKLKPGKSSRSIMADGGITEGQRMKVIGWAAKVSFSDGSIWEDDGSKSCSASSPTP